MDNQEIEITCSGCDYWSLGFCELREQESDGEFVCELHSDLVTPFQCDT